MELAVAVESVPPEWYEDDRLTVTLMDVLEKRAERMKRNRRR